MASILDDVRTSAEWIGTALRSSGYRADFSPGSLAEIDRFFDRNVRGGKPVPRGLLSESVGMRLFAVGAYVGEVLRRELGGEWRGDDANPRAEIDVELHLPDGTVCWPVQRVIKRFESGAEEGIAAYGAGFGLDVTLSPPVPSDEGEGKRPWWKLW